MNGDGATDAARDEAVVPELTVLAFGDDAVYHYVPFITHAQLGSKFTAGQYLDWGKSLLKIY